MAGKTIKRAPGQPLTAAEKREMRRRRARRRAVLRVVVLVALCAVLVLLWQNWDSLAPGKLLNRFQDMIGSSTGSYPVDLSGVSVRRPTLPPNATLLTPALRLPSDSVPMSFAFGFAPRLAGCSSSTRPCR